jgi:hypothetical protein
MKRHALFLLLAGLVAALPVGAQSDPPPLPSLTAEQASRVQQELARYRADTEARVARGEITPDESERLIAWREWQLAQQAAGLAPRPPQIVERTIVAPAYPPAPYYAPRPYYYGPYYGPYYAPPAPVYWGLSLCAGRAYRSGWGSVCI